MFQRFSCEDLSRRPEVAAEWRDLMSRSINLYAMYGSPEWWDHLSAVHPEEALTLVTQRDAAGDLTAAVPLRKTCVDLGVSAARFSMSLGSVPCLEVMGGQPNLPETAQDHRSFFHWVWESFPQDDALYFKSIHSESYFWKFLEASEWRVGDSIVYKISGDRPFHSLSLPDSFDGYLGSFKQKKRYNLKRQVRLMEEANDGQLALEKIISADQLARFEECVRDIAKKSWKQEALNTPVPDILDVRGALSDVASRGLLRSYLLQGKDGASAFVLGYRYRDVYHYSDIGFDESVASLSPGNVLLFLLIKEIIENSDLRRINFGIEDGDYKRQFGNNHDFDASVLIMRPTLRNRQKMLLHGAAAGAKHFVRRVVKRG